MSNSIITLYFVNQVTWDPVIRASRMPLIMAHPKATFCLMAGLMSAALHTEMCKRLQSDSQGKVERHEDRKGFWK